jgi:cardiolipin synthase
MMVFFFLPILGVLIYVLFGRSRKAFTRQRQLLSQNVEANARPLLDHIISRQDDEIRELEGDSVLRRKLMMLVRRNSQSALTARNKVQILQNATAFYPSLIKDMEAARSFIHLQYFIWGSDEFTDKLKAAGIKVIATSPLYRLHTISYRNHRKITVIDGIVGYTGGMNIGREHLSGGDGFSSWRDTQVRIEGDGAAILQAVFVADWYNATQEDLFAKRYFPPAATNPPAGDVPVQILTSGPDSQWAGIRQLYFFMIVNAQSHVMLQSPYFVLDATIAEALRSAALSGIDVKVMLSGRASGNRVPEWAGNTFIMDVLSAGVRVYLYQKGYLHAKTISVDSEICSIGSANVDIRSFSINYEINAVLYDSRLSRELEQDFERDLAHCVEFTAGDYRKRRMWLRFRDSVARLLSPLL